MQALYSSQCTVPYSCQPIGKTILQYDSKNGLTMPSGSSDKGSQTETSSGSITIPGSLLSWRSAKGATAGMHMILFKVTPIADLPISPQSPKRMRKRLETIATNKSSLPRENGFKPHHVSLSAVPHGVSSGNKMIGLALFDQGKKAVLLNGAVNGGFAEHSHLSPIRNGFVNCSHDKNWSLEKRQKKDASVMTDISLGTKHVDCQCIFSDSSQEKQKGAKVLESPPSTIKSPSCVPFASKSAQTLTQDRTNLPLSLPQSPPQSVTASTSTSNNAHSDTAKLPDNHEPAPNTDDGSNVVTTVEEWKQAQVKASSKPVRGRMRKIPGGKSLPLASEAPPAEYIVSIPRKSLHEEHAASEVQVNGLVDEPPEAQRNRKHIKMQLSSNGDSSKDECILCEQLPALPAEKVHSHHAPHSTHVLGSSTQRVSSLAAPKSTTTSSDGTSESLPPNPRKRPHSNLTDPTDSLRELESSPLAKRHAVHLHGESNPRGEPCSFPLTSTPPPAGLPNGPLLSTSGVYYAEFVVFDSRQQCQLVNGDYELLLQKGPSEEKKMEDAMYTTWDTVFGTKVWLLPCHCLIACSVDNTMYSLSIAL